MIKIANCAVPTLSMPQESSHLILTTVYEMGTVIIHILMTKKLRKQTGQQFTPGHTDRKWQS